MVKTRPPKEGNCFHSCHAPCKPTRAIRRTERYRCVKTCMYIYIYMSMFAFHWLRKISRIWLIFVQIVEFMTMLKHHNRKVQRQRVFHSLPSIAVPKRNELVDDSWAPQLVQFISQYFNCDVITLLWMWAICCCAHVQGFEQLGQLVIAPLTKPNVEKYSSCSFNPSSQATIKHPYYYDSPYSHLAPSHFREEGSGLKAARIVNTQAAQDPARESRRYKKTCGRELGWAMPGRRKESPGSAPQSHHRSSTTSLGSRTGLYQAATSHALKENALKDIHSLALGSSSLGSRDKVSCRLGHRSPWPTVSCSASS